MEAVFFSEMSASFYRTARRHILEDSILYILICRRVYKFENGI
jgi:hypothetical protein